MREHNKQMIPTYSGDVIRPLAWSASIVKSLNLLGGSTLSIDGSLCVRLNRLRACLNIKTFQSVSLCEIRLLTAVKVNMTDMPNNPPRNNECHDNTFPTSSKELYWDLIMEIEKSPVSKSKCEQLFPTHDLPWKDIYLLPRSAMLDSKLREFQYKVLSRILYANKALHRMGIVNSPACTFCQVSDKSLEHLFLHCPTSSVVWLSVA